MNVILVASKVVTLSSHRCLCLLHFIFVKLLTKYCMYSITCFVCIIMEILIMKTVTNLSSYQLRSHFIEV